MKCPVCEDVNLVMSDRQGVEIDYCPECRGVWLDRGELDKIIERADPARTARGREQRPGRHMQESEDRSHYKKRKREGFLGELFDF